MYTDKMNVRFVREGLRNESGDKSHYFIVLHGHEAGRLKMHEK